MERKFGAMSSSIDPNQLSLTVSSIVKLAGVLVASYAALTGTNLIITNDQLQSLTDAVVVMITAGFTIYHAGNVIFGLFRKWAAR